MLTEAVGDGADDVEAAEVGGDVLGDGRLCLLPLSPRARPAPAETGREEPGPGVGREGRGGRPEVLGQRVPPAQGGLVQGQPLPRPPGGPGGPAGGRPGQPGGDRGPAGPLLSEGGGRRSVRVSGRVRGAAALRCDSAQGGEEGEEGPGRVLH